MGPYAHFCTTACCTRHHSQRIPIPWALNFFRAVFDLIWLRPRITSPVSLAPLCTAANPPPLPKQPNKAHLISPRRPRCSRPMSRKHTVDANSLTHFIIDPLHQARQLLFQTPRMHACHNQPRCCTVHLYRPSNPPCATKYPLCLCCIIACCCCNGDTDPPNTLHLVDGDCARRFAHGST